MLRLTGYHDPASIVTTMTRLASYASLILMASAFAQAQSKTPTAAESLGGNFADVNRKVLAMAKDFPKDKYNFRLKPEMRSFGEVMVHIASGVMEHSAEHYGLLVAYYRANGMVPPESRPKAK